MSTDERAWVVLSSLGEIFLVCIPVYAALFFAEKFTAWLSAKMFQNIAKIFDDRLLLEKALEKKRWTKQGRDFGDKND